MTTSPDQIPYWHMVWDAQMHIHGDTRNAIISLELPHEIMFRLLVTPKANLAIQKRVASYFVDQAATRFEDVLQYLRAFFVRMAETCNLSSPELAVTVSGRGSEYDFPRPSPSSVMIEEFCKNLRRHRELCEQLRAIPIRWL